MKYIDKLVTILCLVFPLMLCGQNPLGMPMVQNYSKAVFQGGSRTWDIKQDSRGIMYFANNEGLITFDGKYWKRYPLPNHTIVRSIAIDKNDRIYVGGQGEFGYFEPNGNDELAYFSLKSLLPKGQEQFADAWNTVAMDNAIFFRTTQGIFEYRDGQIKVYRASASWEYMGVAGNQLFAQDIKHGLLKFSQGKWQTVLPKNDLDGKKVASMATLGNNSLLITTLTHGDYLLRDRRIVFLPASKPSYELYTPSLSIISKNEYVVATASEGCVIRDEHGRVMQRLGLAEGLQNKNVTTVFVDQQKNIWAGVDNGIVVISYGSAIRYLRPNLENDVTGYSALVFNRKLYLTSSNGAYVTALQPQYKNHSQSANNFHLLSESDGGEAWRLTELNGQLFLTHNRGLFALEDDRVVTINPGAGSWLPLPLSAVYPVDQALLGTYYGLDLMQFKEGKLETVTILKGKSDSYRFLELDNNGDIWASHPYRGIYHLTISKDSKSYEARLFTEKDGLPSSFQNYVFSVKNKVLFTTKEGIYIFDKHRQRFSPATGYEDFSGIAIKYLKEDVDGNLWFCSEKKVGVAYRNASNDSYRVAYLPELEGHQTSGFENIYPYDRNNVYIGSEKGLIHIDFENYTAVRHKPRVLLSSIKATGDRDSMIFDGYSSYVSKTGQADLTIERELPANFDSFLFKYTSPSYGIHGHMSFSYFLVGYDKEWSAWTTETEKAYTNLPNGTYTFKVRAKNNLSEESDIAAYSFVIQPPWYKSIWAVAFYLAVSVFGIYALVIWQKRTWRKQEDDFNKKLAQLRYIHQLEIEKNEKEIVKLQNEKLEHEVLSKTKELASTSMQLMENTGALSKLRVELAKLDVGDEDGHDLKKITSLLNDVEKNSSHWDQFASHFDELNDGFMHRLKAKNPALSRNDLKVCAYLRLNFSTKQIAQLQNISVRGVEIHRYRIRKKLGITSEISTADYLSNI
ncbi:ligand-binding sensor domain-containing protein [Sphingobacterium deserti]|uniref:Two component regulator three Y domain protein n=1 Tax=Sphingobacterium deserti TaxID=1229276 RepID=A0A0B8TAV5_9SPHI|nr:triple tyrosine motif-containing protein [Sphingobacterium deserti]KGE15999.1 two component regulator three Y domain protein [Sphingobacterium deserti]